MYKKCNKCMENMPFELFSNDKRNKDGKQGICEICRKNNKHLIRENRIKAGTPILVENKTCNKCQQNKIAADFYKDAGIADGLSTICKQCKNKNVENWRGKKREEYNAYMRKYRTTHPIKYSHERNRGLRRRYGIDQKQYDEMLEKQNQSCAICRCKPGARPFHVDHCHNTEKVRGLLCASCNRSIAILDDKELLQRAFEYLKS